MQFRVKGNRVIYIVLKFDIALNNDDRSAFFARHIAGGCHYFDDNLLLFFALKQLNTAQLGERAAQFRLKNNENGNEKRIDNEFRQVAENSKMKLFDSHADNNCNNEYADKDLRSLGVAQIVQYPVDCQVKQSNLGKGLPCQYICYFAHFTVPNTFSL